ncbi:unnamed protein product [Notodromas monacha]|uniref:Thiamin pyrophosphokinase thiamin-binding domain-containing protein n=1 Tax=Notodromas monacha TaxID=399045 RepID=A0A7R9GDF9_9CRUS|nr:unnamed protein product [Notodromas monacha]CAG0918638.1 unnamed protein product [Notodromas monacha]
MSTMLSAGSAVTWRTAAATGVSRLKLALGNYSAAVAFSHSMETQNGSVDLPGSTDGMSSSSPPPREWRFRRLFDAHGGAKFATVVLNSEIGSERKATVFDLWKRAKIKVAVDGGLNRIWGLVKERSETVGVEDEQSLIPDLVTGDFDSASPGLVDALRKRGSNIVPTPDQDETDFTKSLRILHHLLIENKSLEIEAVIVIGSNGPRLDHIFGLIHTLHKKENMKLLGEVNLFLLMDEDICWLLPPGGHILEAPKTLRGETCGLIPFQRPAKGVTSTGLKWNLENQTLEFGNLISTSNKFTEVENIGVQCNDPILWISSLNFSAKGFYVSTGF